VLAGAVAWLSLWSTTAGADTAPVVGGSWYWFEQAPRNVPNSPTPLGFPAALPAPPDVPSGDLAVAIKGGDPGSGTDAADDKESFLHIDTAAIPTGSSVSRFKLTLKEDPNGRSLNAANATIKAYPVTGFFADGVAAGSWEDRPSFDRTLAEGAGTRAPDGIWTFDLTGIVGKWVAGTLPNNGLAFVAAGVMPGTQPFQVVWATSPLPTTDGAFTPPESTETPTTEVTSDTATIDSGPVVITPDVSTPFVAPVETPVPTAAGPTIAPTGGRARPIARSRADHALPAAFFLAAIAVLGLVGTAVVALGEAGEPIAPRRGSVMRALERRIVDPA
jgi:hypothetical protein